MSDINLTKAEKRYLEDLRKLPYSVRSRVLNWALEVIASIGLFVYGLVTDSRLWIVLGFLSLLYFSVWRMFGQLRGIRLFDGIYQKAVALEQDPGTQPSGGGHDAKVVPPEQDRDRSSSGSGGQ